MLPNFIVIGAPKCGTTSLCHLLGNHPQVFMSKVKEPHYFGRKDPTKTLLWYEEHFVGAEDKKAIGEGSTSSFTSTYNTPSRFRHRKNYSKMPADIYYKKSC